MSPVTNFMSALLGPLGGGAKLEVRPGYCVISATMVRPDDEPLRYPEGFSPIAVCESKCAELYGSSNSRCLTMRNGRLVSFFMADDTAVYDRLVNAAIRRLEELSGPLVI